MQHIRSTALFAAALAAAFACRAAVADADDRATFDRLRTLAGEWSGRMDDPLAGDPVTVRYEVVSAGRAILEYQNPGKSFEMVTVYFLADGRLHATHYCAAGNQPAWRLAKQSTPDLAMWEFMGGTGFDPEKDGHVHQGEIRFVSDDRIEHRWDHFIGPKAQGSTHWFLERVKPAPPAPAEPPAQTAAPQ